MSLQLSINVPVSEAPQWFFRKSVPVSSTHYDNWTLSDYEHVYGDANRTRYTWDDVVVPIRRPRRVKMPQAIPQGK